MSKYVKEMPKPKRKDKSGVKNVLISPVQIFEGIKDRIEFISDGMIKEEIEKGATNTKSIADVVDEIVDRIEHKRNRDKLVIEEFTGIEVSDKQLFDLGEVLVFPLLETQYIDDKDVPEEERVKLDTDKRLTDLVNMESAEEYVKITKDFDQDQDLNGVTAKDIYKTLNAFIDKDM